MNCKGASRVYLIIQRYVWQETLSMGLVEEARPPFQEPPMHCLSWPEMVLLTSFKEPCDSLTTSDVSPRHSSHNPCTTLFSGNTKFIIFLTLKFLPTSSGVPPPHMISCTYQKPVLRPRGVIVCQCHFLLNFLFVLRRGSEQGDCCGKARAEGVPSELCVSHKEPRRGLPGQPQKEEGVGGLSGLRPGEGCPSRALRTQCNCFGRQGSWVSPSGPAPGIIEMMGGRKRVSNHCPLNKEEPPVLNTHSAPPLVPSLSYFILKILKEKQGTISQLHNKDIPKNSCAERCVPSGTRFHPTLQLASSWGEEVGQMRAGPDSGQRGNSSRHWKPPSLGGQTTVT